MGASLSAIPFEALLAFFESLRPEIVVGVDQVLAVQRLLTGLAERGALPTDLAKLRFHIAPIVCRTRSEQQQFAERFDAWLSAVAPGITITPKRDDPASEPKDVRRARLRRLVWGAMSAVLIAVIAIEVFRKGISGVVFPWQTPVPNIPTVPNALPSPSPAVGLLLELRTDLVTQEPIPVSESDLTSALAIALLTAVMLAWLLRRVRAWFEARRFLARDATAIPVGLDRLVVGVDGGLLRDPAFKALSIALSAREQSRGSDLDVGATVDATVRAAGVLSPVAKQRRKLPDYVALIERESTHDVQAGLFDHWLDRLHAWDLSIVRYYFRREPRLLWTPDSSSPPRNIRHVQAATRDYRLMIFSDGEHFLSAISGRVQRWMEELLFWPQRALITPRPSACWSERERAIMAAGLPVLPATAVGLVASREASARRLTVDDADLFPPTLPRILREREREWLHDDAPSREEQVNLLAHLRAYLGPRGYRWFAACALYPQVRLPLTVALGGQLRDSDGPLFTRTLLQRIARLPWMRSAYMPDWLRTLLLHSLSRGELAQVRAALGTILLSAVAPGKQELVLELANQGSGPMRELIRQLLGRIRKSAPSRDIVRDRVFLKWMPTRLSLSLPLARGAGSERFVTEDSGPPHPLSSMLGSLFLHFVTLVASLPFLLLLMVALAGELFAKNSATWFIGGAVFSTQLLASLLVILRWRQRRYVDHPALRWRILGDELLPAAVWAYLASWAGQEGAFVGVLAFYGALATVCLIVVTWGLRVARTIPSTGIESLASMLDRWMRAVFGARRRSVSLPPASWIHSGVAAFLIAPCSSGLAMPFYALALPMRYDVSLRGLTRSLLEIAFCWAPVFVGFNLDLLARLYEALFFARFDDWRLAVGGWLVSSLYCAGVFFVRRVPQPSGKVSAWARAIDHYAPDRWLGIRPIVFRACVLVVASAMALHAWRIDPQRIQTVLSMAQEAPTWPREAAIESAVLLRHGNSREVRSAELSPDGTRVVTASYDKTARIWDAVTGKPLTPPLEHEDYLYGAAFSPDGTRVVTASGDNAARIWDAVTGKPLTFPLEHKDDVYGAAFSPDGTRVVTASWDNTARVWDAATGKPLTPPLEHQRWINGAAFSPDGTRVVTASGDQTARVWDAATANPLTPPLKHEGEVNGAAFSPDGTRVVTASKDNTARIWDAATGMPLTPPLKHQDIVTSAAFSPDGTRVVTASKDKTARIWNAGSGVPYGPLLIHQEGVSGAEFGPDGSYIVTASEDRTAGVWDAAEGNLIVRLRGHSGPVNSAHFGRDGRLVVTASADGTTRVWDVFSFSKRATSGGLAVPAKDPLRVHSALQGKVTPTTGLAPRDVEEKREERPPVASTTEDPSMSPTLAPRAARRSGSRAAPVPGGNSRAGAGSLQGANDADMEGGLSDFDSKLVVAKFKVGMRGIQFCYEKQLRRNLIRRLPNDQGRVVVQFTIEQSGTVSKVTAAENSTNDPAVAACVIETVKRFRFNPGPEGGSVTFSYPIVFAPQG